MTQILLPSPNDRWYKCSSQNRCIIWIIATYNTLFNLIQYVFPKLSPEACDVIQKFYLELRQSHQVPINSITVTFKIVLGHSKSRLHPTNKCHPLSFSPIWFNTSTFIYLFIYWARIKKNIHDRWCEKKWEISAILREYTFYIIYW